MPERTILDRVTDAITQLRDPLPSKMLGDIERKDNPPDYGRYAGTTNNLFDYRSSYSWPRYRPSTAVNYRQEIGPLDGNSLIMTVVNYTGTRLPEAKPVVLIPKANNKVDKDPEHPAALLIKRPNPHHVWANYTYACSLAWWIDGNVFFYKSRAMTGEVVELWYLPHYLIEPRWPNDGRSPEVPIEKGQSTFLSHYQFNVPGRVPELIPAGDMIHLKRGALTEQRRAPSPIEPLIKELYGDDKMAQFTAAIMRNMGIQVPLISPKEQQSPIDKDRAAEMKEQWMQKTTGERAGEPVINSIPVDVEKFGFSPSELDLSQLRLIPESRVAAVLQIPATALGLMVGLQNGTSYASSEQARQQGYEEVIIPIQSAWAEEFTWQLLNEFEGSEGSRLDFDTSEVRVLQEDQDAKYKRETEVFKSGGTTFDQYLEALGKDPIGAPLGDVRLVPSLASPMTPDQLLGKADGSLAPEPAPLPVDPNALAKFADIDRWKDWMEDQMKDFQPQ